MSTAVLGAGSWGTALAMQLARAGHAVVLWSRDPDQARQMAEERQNARYLPGLSLAAPIRATSNLQEAVAAASRILVCAVPSHGVRDVMAQAAPHLGPDTVVVSAAKGIEEGTYKRMSEVIQEATGSARVSVLSGPSFAKEVAIELPTVVTAAADDEAVSELVQTTFATPMFRVYRLVDMVGVEIGGTVKNVIAIASGVGDGLGLGHNARSAIITRGLAEVNRLAMRLGADPQTVTGLAGMGDLVLTCTGDLSRNRSVGLRLGRGESLEEILGSMKQVAEGVGNTQAVSELARSVDVEMPITAEMHALLFEGKSPHEAMVDLMTRQLKREF